MNLKINNFVVFKNFRKKDNDKAPDMMGEMLVECQHCHQTNEFDLSVWGKTTKTGHPMLTGNFKAPDFESEYYKKRKLDDMKSLEEFKKTADQKAADLGF